MAVVTIKLQLEADDAIVGDVSKSDVESAIEQIVSEGLENLDDSDEVFNVFDSADVRVFVESGIDDDDED